MGQRRPNDIYRMNFDIYEVVIQHQKNKVESIYPTTEIEQTVVFERECFELELSDEQDTS
jgi:hypothetical protein